MNKKESVGWLLFIPLFLLVVSEFVPKPYVKLVYFVSFICSVLLFVWRLLIWQKEKEKHEIK